MRAAICVRVSPRPKEAVRYSPELQESKCRDWAEQNDAEVVTVIQDILVSGGSADRFDSIFKALDEYAVDTFIVSDLSRWTRDRPSRFWAIKSILEDRHVKLVSVDEPWLGSEVPFSDTVTTAKVEANYQERLVLKQKTKAGMKAAWAKGKRWGHPWGWSWDPDARKWSQDVALITGFFRDYADGMGLRELSARYAVLESNVKSRITAVSQREVVGDELWERAQARASRPWRRPRTDAKVASIYRGLLRCPFCRSKMQHHPTFFGHYYCPDKARNAVDHPWSKLSTLKWVTPTIEQLLGQMALPEAEAQALEAYQAPDPVDLAPTPDELRKQMDRLTEAWVRGRITPERYERMMAGLEEELNQPKAPALPLDDRIEIVRGLGIINLRERDRELGMAANAILHELFEEILLLPDRTPKPILREEYRHWLEERRPALAAVASG